jgi:hypothetical protein
VSKPYLTIIIVSAYFLLAFTPIEKVDTDKQNASTRITSTTTRNSYKAISQLLYDSLNLSQYGLSKQALEYACKGYEKLERKGIIKNPGILTICDFTMSSFKKRMFIIDLANFKMLVNTYVAHGKNSGIEYARNFSNKAKSLASSLGFFVTKNTYFGKHGLSLRLAGLESGFNDKAEQRAVVIHGAPYIGDKKLNSEYMGRSFGCPAVPQSVAPKVINLIKDGTCLFIYHPSARYLHGSKILNG